MSLVVNPAERIGSCVARPSKIVCVGLNYAKHAEETKQLSLQSRYFFLKQRQHMRTYDAVVIPKNSKKTDWEVELAVVIGKKDQLWFQKLKPCILVRVMHCTMIIANVNFSLSECQWVKGKSADTLAPLGPFLATTDEIKDPHALDLWLSVNGIKLQYSNTNDMIFKIPFLVSYISQFMTLLPGDVIFYWNSLWCRAWILIPPRYLSAGDVVELSIDGLGTQKQIAVSYE